MVRVCGPVPAGVAGARANRRRGRPLRRWQAPANRVPGTRPRSVRPATQAAAVGSIHVCSARAYAPGKRFPKKSLGRRRITPANAHLSEEECRWPDPVPDLVRVCGAVRSPERRLRRSRSAGRPRSSRPALNRRPSWRSAICREAAGPGRPYPHPGNHETYMRSAYYRVDLRR